MVGILFVQWEYDKTAIRGSGLGTGRGTVVDRISTTALNCILTKRPSEGYFGATKSTFRRVSASVAYSFKRLGFDIQVRNLAALFLVR